MGWSTVTGDHWKTCPPCEKAGSGMTRHSLYHNDDTDRYFTICANCSREREYGRGRLTVTTMRQRIRKSA